MIALVRPAPLWRRLAAAFYDLLLLLAVWLVALFADAVVRDLGGFGRNWRALQLLEFLLGLGLFGWQWTAGGRTVGMRAWHLQVRRLDGAPLRWPVAAVRYAAMLASWLIALAPAVLAALPQTVAVPHRGEALFLTALLTALALAAFFLDPRRRAPHDWLAQTEVVVV